MVGSERRATSRDVAAAAGVSRSTVSFVLNNTPSQTIPERTRQAVLTAARDLDYVPSVAAQVLRSGRSKLVLCLVPPWATTESLVGFVKLVGDELTKHGLVTVTHVAVPGQLRDLLTVIAPGAVVSLAPLDPSDDRRLARLGVPHVPAYILDYPGHPHSMSLTQQRMGSAQALHLIDRGFAELVYVSGPEIGHPGRPAGRFDGAEHVTRSHPHARIRRFAYKDSPGLEVLVESWATSPVRVGVCAFDDLTALEVLAHLRAHGVPVPDHVGVVGVDDIPAARFSEPTLTTVRPAMDGQARELARRVLSAVGDSEDPGTQGLQVSELVTAEAIVRKST